MQNRLFILSFVRCLTNLDLGRFNYVFGPDSWIMIIIYVVIVLKIGKIIVQPMLKSPVLNSICRNRIFVINADTFWKTNSLLHVFSCLSIKTYNFFASLEHKEQTWMIKNFQVIGKAAQMTISIVLTAYIFETWKNETHTMSWAAPISSITVKKMTKFIWKTWLKHNKLWFSVVGSPV